MTPSVTITSRIISGGPGTPSQEWGFTATCNVTCTAYDWDFGDGATSVDSHADEQHVYTRKGNYRVSVTARRSTSGGNPITGALDIVIQ